MASWWSREGLPLLSPDPASVGDAARARDQALPIRRTFAQVSRAESGEVKPLTYSAALLLYIALPAHGITNRQPTLPIISAASTEAVTMEVVVSKPRVSYSAFKAAQPQSQYEEHSIAYAIQWRIDEARKPGARPIGDSASYSLHRLQRAGIGAKIIGKLTAQDFADHGRERIASGVKPETVMQDWSSLRATIRDYVETNELPLEWLLMLKKAGRKLEKEQLISKGVPRDRLPTLEELGLFRSHYERQNQHKRTRTNMVRVMDGLVLLGRRVGELTRIERQHINVEKRTYWVYDLKNSKGKGHHGEAALIEGAWELVESILSEIPNEPTAKLFPYNSRTCSQRQTLAKKKLQKEHPHLFQNLRMHDQRAYCFTGLLKKGYTALQVRRVSLHSTTKMIDTVYGRLTAADVVQGPLGQPIQPRV